jgi:hypothetical protein
MGETKSYFGVVAEFDSAAAIYAAAKKTTDAGYTRVDSHTPFPVHGIDAMLKQPSSHVGWVCALMGLLGIGGAQLMMWWMNAHDYEIWVSGKLPYAWPATIPITFECMVLLAAFGAVFGMLGFNKLPRLHHPIFTHSTFGRATDDRFFLSIECTDPMFDQVGTVRFLEGLGGKHVELVEE